MSILDEIKQMKSSGMNDSEIVKQMQQRGISPKQIEDALNQNKIKQAVSKEENNENNYNPPAPEPQAQQSSSNIQNYDSNYYAPSSQQNTTQQNYDNYYSGGYNSGDYGNYSESDYGNYANYNSNLNSVIDIAQQIFSDNIKDIEKEINNLKEFKATTETKVENVSSRLKKIEDTIDKLQLAILDKVGSYGKDLSEIKKEMSMIENSFKKMTGQAAEKISKKISSKKNTKRTKK